MLGGIHRADHHPASLPSPHQHSITAPPLQLTRTHLIEEALRELLEALGTHEALLVVELAIAVDNLLSGCKATPAALAAGVGQGIGHVAATDRGYGSQMAALPDSLVWGHNNRVLSIKLASRLRPKVPSPLSHVASGCRPSGSLTSCILLPTAQRAPYPLPSP